MKPQTFTLQSGAIFCSAYTCLPLQFGQTAAPSLPPPKVEQSVRETRNLGGRWAKIGTAIKCPVRKGVLSLIRVNQWRTLTGIVCMFTIDRHLFDVRQCLIQPDRLPQLSQCLKWTGVSRNPGLMKKKDSWPVTVATGRSQSCLPAAENLQSRLFATLKPVLKTYLTRSLSIT